MFAIELYEKIIEAWEADQNNPDRMRQKKPLPKLADVRAIIDTTFWASLNQEEGCAITFALALLPKSSLTEGKEVERRQIFCFHKSLPLSVESVTKLAAAFDPRTTALIVGPSDHKGNHEIWGGIFFLMPFIKLFQTTPARSDLSYTERPDAFTVTAIAPGSLLISRGYAHIGRLGSGEFIRATPTPFTTEAMGKFIKAAISQDPGFVHNQSTYFRKYINCFDYLLGEASRRGHGATIVVIPDKQIAECKEHFAPEISFDGDLKIEFLLIEMLKAEHGSKLEHSDDHFRRHINLEIYNKECADRLSLLAQFSAIDGALVLSSRLEIISFGATLTAPEWKGNVLVGPDGFGGGGGAFDTLKLGTRHSSAINFVGKCSGCICFVLSEDGSIRGLAKESDQTILCWPDCRYSMFV